MSLANSQTLSCPACGAANTADVFHSINADRRPDLREGVLDRTFQVVTCDACGQDFRIDPEFNYLDAGRNQWIAVHPFGALGNWETILAEDQESFDKAYGAAASAGARAIGDGLTVRVTFGWAAFREKLVAAEAGIDDVALELLKIAILRQLPDAPLSQAVEPRLVNVVGDDLVLAWIDARTDTPGETMVVPMDAYETIAVDRQGWGALRADIAANAFVDMQRLMI